MPEPNHIPVLPDEVLRELALSPGEVYIDCTAGLGGHAELVALSLGPSGTVVLNDLDAGNLERASARLVATGVRVVKVQGNFAELPGKLAAMGLRGDVVLADLGFASNQMDDGLRGFSFMREGPLDMRLDSSSGMTAAEWVGGMDERELVRILREYGEEKDAVRIARKIVQARREAPIETTGRLAEVVRSATGPARGGIDPATRTFQALRILVNDELGSLEAFLARLERGERGGWLSGKARVGVISFHSLEDRLVKRAFEGLEKKDGAAAVGPVTAGEAEVLGNPRSRSAKLRVVRFADAG